MFVHYFFVFSSYTYNDDLVINNNCVGFHLKIQANEGQYKCSALDIIPLKETVSIPCCKPNRVGPTDLHRTKQVSDSYAWQIAISHDLGLKEMGVKLHHTL